MRQGREARRVDVGLVVLQDDPGRALIGRLAAFSRHQLFARLDGLGLIPLGVPPCRVTPRLQDQVQIGLAKTVGDRLGALRRPRDIGDLEDITAFDQSRIRARHHLPFSPAIEIARRTLITLGVPSADPRVGRPFQVIDDPASHLLILDQLDLRLGVGL